jgi:hypothetical protein
MHFISERDSQIIVLARKAFVICVPVIVSSSGNFLVLILSGYTRRGTQPFINKGYYLQFWRNGLT